MEKSETKGSMTFIRKVVEMRTIAGPIYVSYANMKIDKRVSIKIIPEEQVFLWGEKNGEKLN